MKTVYLVTKSFPYTNEERSFLGPEYEYLKSEFDLTVVTTELEPGNIGIKEEQNKVLSLSKQRTLAEKLVSLGRFLLEKDCYEEIRVILKSRENVWQRIFRALMFGSAAETFFKRFKNILQLQKDTDAIVYFYWYDYKCFGMTMHKHQYPNIRMIARTHGYDLYDERELYGRQFFKEQMDRELDRLIFAAAFAKDYYLKRYHKTNGVKYPLYRLGVSEKQMTLDQRRSSFEPDSFLLLSCSHVINIKRVELIIEGLAQTDDRKIRWIHLGNGEQFEQTCDLAARMLGNKKNISFEFRGEIPNDQVLQFYRENYVGAFITTTSTEGGSPVSVQEALSFGVPVIATAIAELPVMTEGNGILLPEDPKKEDVAAAIKTMYDLYGTEQYFTMCRKALEQFRTRFHAERNYTELMKELHYLADD